MSLATTIEQLKKTLPRAGVAYAEGRSRHPALAPYESPTAALAAIDRGSSLRVVERDAILLAILDELQKSPAPIWQSFLLVAFAPMLVRFRARLRRPDCENLDQCVLVAFLETARSFPHRSYIQRNLRLGTGARLRAERRRDHRASDLEVLDEEMHAPRAPGADAYLKSAAAEVVQIVEATGGEELCDALIARHGAAGSMKDYVASEHVGLSPRELARLCDRLYRAEAKALRRVRARVKQRERRFAFAA
jgi:hypothetical protein